VAQKHDIGKWSAISSVESAVYAQSQEKTQNGNALGNNRVRCVFRIGLYGSNAPGWYNGLLAPLELVRRLI